MKNKIIIVLSLVILAVSLNNNNLLSEDLAKTAEARKAFGRLMEYAHPTPI